MSVFARFAPRLQQAIVARLGWSSLRPVQEEAGEALLAGMNALILAPTAGGKTEASMFPTLSALVQDQPDGLGAVYIAPLKALLNNQSERLGLYTEMVGLGRFVWHGDTADHERRRFLSEPTELLMTTPESLEVMLISRRVDEASLFSDLRVIILDEIHAVAGTDRGAHLMSVIERIARLSRHDVQRVGLSATVGNPEAILSWLQGTSKRPGKVVDPPKQPARRQLLVVHRPGLAELASDASQIARGTKSLFFCQSRSTTEAVAESMRRRNTKVFVHHSAVSKEEREIAEERFQRGSDACIVCTSTLELGIDVGDLDKVLQAEAPGTVRSFLQRMGRTGRRADQVANTTFFCETGEGVLQAIALVELAKSGWVEQVEVNDRCWPVVIHQLLAMALAGGGITLEAAWEHLNEVPDFGGIHRAEFERLVAWMLRDGSLILTSGRLILGSKAERRFGRRNFMEFFAVFSSPQSYTVQKADGEPLGSLNQAFVDRLVDGVSCFLLGGRPWAVLSVLHDSRRVLVESAPRGRQPTWGGFLPHFLGHTVCQATREVLASDQNYGYLTPEASSLLEARRAEMRSILESGRWGIEVDSDEIRWWTFAGGRINSTLRYALLALNRHWTVIPDNHLIKVRGQDLALAKLLAAIEQLGDIAFWENEQLWQGVSQGLPGYRLSKFQPLMPPWVEREVVASYLLDVAGAWRWLSGAGPGVSDSLDRVPASIGRPTPQDQQKAVSLPPPRAAVPVVRQDGRQLDWVDDPQTFEAMCLALREETVVGLDVETTLHNRALCLIQIAARECTYLVDALEIGDLETLSPLLGDTSVVKVIHNAAFERGVLSRYGIEIKGIVDTLAVSRRVRGKKAPGGHSLKAVCEREFGFTLDKSEQTSDWTRRPLTESQISYAALDAEVLIRLHEQFRNPTPIPEAGT